MEVYSRARALFVTVAFVLLLDHSFFSLQDSLFIEDKLFYLVHMTVDRRRSPPSFFAAARGVSMLQHFADEIRTTQMKRQDGPIIGRLGNQRAKMRNRVFLQMCFDAKSYCAP